MHNEAWRTAVALLLGAPGPGLRQLEQVGQPSATKISASFAKQRFRAAVRVQDQARVADGHDGVGRGVQDRRQPFAARFERALLIAIVRYIVRSGEEGPVLCRCNPGQVDVVAVPRPVAVLEVHGRARVPHEPGGLGDGRVRIVGMHELQERSGAQLLGRVAQHVRPRGIELNEVKGGVGGALEAEVPNEELLIDLKLRFLLGQACPHPGRREVGTHLTRQELQQG